MRGLWITSPEQGAFFEIEGSNAAVFVWISSADGRDDSCQNLGPRETECPCSCPLSLAIIGVASLVEQRLDALADLNHRVVARGT